MSKWKLMNYKGTHLVIDDEGRLVATGATLEDAEIIIREHNSQAALLAACKEAAYLLREAPEIPNYEGAALRVRIMLSTAAELAEGKP